MGMEVFALDGAEDFVTACRRTYMQALLGAHIGWGKLDLAQWLEGPYRSLAEQVPPDSQPLSSSTTFSEKARVSITGDKLTRMLDMMRVDVLLVLHELATPHGLSAFASLAFDMGLVKRDEQGFIVPRMHARMSLVDRVLSLVAVDALSKPQDFESSFFVCERCHLPVFDALARPNGVCRVHVSGVQTT